MWKDSIRNSVVIFQPNILRIVGFYVRHSANAFFVTKFTLIHGLRTPNEGKNQRNLKIRADVADKICCRHT